MVEVQVLKVDDKGLALQSVKAITPENLHKNFGNDEEDMSVSPVMELDVSTIISSCTQAHLALWSTDLHRLLY